MSGKKFGGIKVDNDHVTHKTGSGPLAGSTATIDTAGEIDRRLSASRVVLTGGLGLFWKKKVDRRELYVMIEGPEYAIVEEVNPDRGKQAREFVAWFNTQSKQLAAAPPPLPSPVPPVGWRDMEVQGASTNVTFDFASLTFANRVKIGPQEEKRIPIVQVTGVSLKDASAMVNGAIEFNTPTGTEKVVFRKKQQDAFVELQSAIESAIADHAPAAAPAPPPLPSSSVPPPPPTPAGWLADPTGRHELRFWDGVAWSANVSDNGTQAVDPL